MKIVLALVVAATIALAVSNWLWMLYFGVIWAKFHVLAPIGYWDTLPLAVLGGILLGGSAAVSRR